MARQVDIIVNTILKGEKGLTQLRGEINALNRTLQDRVLMQRTVDAQIEKSIMNNEVYAETTLLMMHADKGQIQTMVDSKIRAEALNLAYEKRIELLQRQRLELVLNEMAQKGEITVTEASMLQKKMKMNMDMEEIRLLQVRRRETLATTMSIFGMTMSIWQITNAMSALAGENKELKKDIQSLQAVMMGATGPILFAFGLMQLSLAWAKLNIAIKVGLPMFFTLASLYMALTASSRELRIIFGALTGAMVAMTAVIAFHNIQKALEVKLTWAAVTAKLAEMGLLTLGAGLVVGAAIIGAAVAYMATVPKEGAQTRVGQFRRVETTGLLLAHKGETVGRVTPPMEGGEMGTRSPQIIVLEVDGEELVRVLANRFERETFLG